MSQAVEFPLATLKSDTLIGMEIDAIAAMLSTSWWALTGIVPTYISRLRSLPRIEHGMPQW